MFGLGKRHLTPGDRAQILRYVDASFRVSAFQDHEADLHNRVLQQHILEIEDPESLRLVVLATGRVALANKEALRRHLAISSVPDVAGADYAGWYAFYAAICEWSDAAYDTFVSISQGKQAYLQRVESLKAEAGRKNASANKATANLCRGLNVSAAEVQDLMRAAQDVAETSMWQPASSEETDAVTDNEAPQGAQERLTEQDVESIAREKTSQWLSAWDMEHDDRASIKAEVIGVTLKVIIPLT